MLCGMLTAAKDYITFISFKFTKKVFGRKIKH